jgi:hypothetical protein
MATAEPGSPLGDSRAGHHDLPTLLAQAEELLGQLQALQQRYGTYLEQLTTVNWAALAQQGHLAGIPKFRIERTITDARNVLSGGLRDITAVLQLAQEPRPNQEAVDKFVERVRALVRLYTDTPADMRSRCQRLMAWVSQIDAALQQQGEPPLTARLTASPAATP